MKAVSFVNLRSLAFALTLLAGVQARATNYYISPAGSDANDGTAPDKAWQTVGRVNRATLAPGDRVLLEGRQRLVGNLLVTASGTPDAPITIASYGKGPATIQAGDSYGIRLLNCRHIEVRDLVLLGSGVKANGQTTNTAQGLDIFSTATRGKPWQSIRADGLVVSGFREGIVLHTPIGTQDVVGYNDVRITHCTTRECLFGGIYCWGAKKTSGRPWNLPLGNGLFTNVYVGDCLIERIYCDPVGDPLLGLPIQVLNTTNCLVERCTIRDCGQAANPRASQGGIGGLVFLECDKCVAQFNECYHMVTTIGCDGCAFDTDGGCTHCTLQYNYSHDNEGSGFQAGPFAGCSPFADNTIRYNISENDAQKNPGSTGGIMTWGSQPRGQIYHNTVFVGKGFAGNGEVVKPFAFRGGAGFTVRNNIFVAGHDGEFLAPGGCSFQNNCYWRTNGDLHMAGCASLAAWRKHSGQEMLNGAAVGFQVDPRLRAAGHGGNIDNPAKLARLSAYDLLPSSPLLGKGLDLERLFKIAPGPCDFRGTPLRPGTQHSPGAIDEPTIATAYDASPAHR